MDNPLFAPMLLGAWKLVLVILCMLVARITLLTMDKTLTNSTGKSFNDWYAKANSRDLAIYYGLRVAAAFVAAGLVLS